MSAAPENQYAGSTGAIHLPEAEAEHVEEAEQWLISYADLMTLLFGLFAMMFAFAKFDDNDSVVKVDKALVKFFGQTVVKPKDDEKEKGDSKELTGRDRGNDVGNYSGLGEQLRVQLEKVKTAKDATFKQGPDGFEINFVSSTLFDSGKAELKSESVDLLHTLAAMVKNTGLDYYIRVEGHTDDNPIRTGVFPSNWELSAARAGSIIRTLEGTGFPSEKLTAVGFGSSRPAFPNRGPDGKTIAENQALNRRVVIKVMLPEDEARKSGPAGAKRESMLERGDAVLHAQPPQAQ